MKNSKLILLVGGMLVVGVVLGIFISRGLNSPSGTSAPAPSDQGQGQGQGQAVYNFQKIQDLKGIVKQYPNNRNAWVELGDAYFDANQPTDAVKAYDKALKLNPDDPDVLTDQGVMYRRLGEFHKAIDDFEKAQKINPNHSQSLFNMGIVYRYDLKNLAKARQVWQEFLVRHPSGSQAAEARQELDQLKSLSGGFPGK